MRFLTNWIMTPSCAKNNSMMSKKTTMKYSTLVRHSQQRPNNPQPDDLRLGQASHLRVLKPQTDLKPTFLIKDCTLPEFNKFTETFITYINSSGSAVPAEAIYSNLRVHMDPYWFTELIGAGLKIQTELPSFPRLMDEVSLVDTTDA